MENKKGKYFFGWNNIRWFMKNLILLYSTTQTKGLKSYFSKKRVESGIAFIIGEWGMIYWLLTQSHSMTTTDFGIWAGIQFFIAGYMVNQIEKAKVEKNKYDREHEFGLDNNGGYSSENRDIDR